MLRNQVIHVLSKFRYVNKYEAFHEILPDVLTVSERERSIVSEILNGCCAELLAYYQESERPNKGALKKSLVTCMDALSVADINATNREFGYQLGWYLAEKVHLNLKKGTEKKLWGYWQVEGSEVKIPLRPRISASVRKKQQKEKQPRKKQGSAQMV